MDMLIKLYDLQGSPLARVPESVRCRKPLPSEHGLISDWVAREFSAGWAAEAQAALSNRPVSLFIALRAEALIGFCCYDATARGFVGPIGIAANERRSGIGAALVWACLHDMQAVGYAYAVAGAVGAPEFFRRVSGAVEIEGSSPGLYQDMLRP